jgi:hypothetical protein
LWDAGENSRCDRATQYGFHVEPTAFDSIPTGERFQYLAMAREVLGIMEGVAAFRKELQLHRFNQITADMFDDKECAFCREGERQ